MKIFLASIFRFFFRISFFRKYYFAAQKHIFTPIQFFKNTATVVEYRDSIRINIHLDDWILQQIYFLGDYEKPEIDFLYQFLKKGDTFVDVGANIGLFSLNASKILGNSGKVYAFEAFSPNYRQFINNISINNFENISAWQFAISYQNSSIEIRYNPKDKNIGMASAYLKNFTTTETVPCTSLDDFVEKNNIEKIKLIKIDIEGGEYNALKGMKSILNTHKPAVLIEINEVALSNSNHSKSQILDIFEEYHYKKTKILSQNRHAYNALFQFED